MKKVIKILILSICFLLVVGCYQEYEVKNAVRQGYYHINIEGTINYDSENCNYYFSSSDGKYSNYILDNKTKYIFDDETIIEYSNPEFLITIDNLLGNIIYCDIHEIIDTIDDDIYYSVRRIYSSSREESYYTQEILKDITRW